MSDGILEADYRRGNHAVNWIHMKHLGVIAASVLVFFLQGPVYVRHMWDRLPDAGDSIINAWILAWNAHALSDSSLSVWDAPLFYPIENALTFSETLFGNLWLTLPVQYITGNHVLTANVLLFFSFILSSYCVFLLAYNLTGHYGASLAAGLIFSFHPYRWFHASHLQLLPIFWTPLAFIFAIRFFKSRRRVPFFLMLLMIWMQYYSCIYLGTMLVITLGIYTLFFFCFGEQGRERFRLVLDPGMLKLMFAGLAGSVLVLLPLGWPYIRTARKLGFVRSLSENSLYSAEPLSFILGISENSGAYQFLNRIPLDIRLGEGAVFLGLVPICLLVLNRVLNSRREKLFNKDQKLMQRSFFWTGLILMILMLGPYLVIFNEATAIPMPYQLFYYIFPGARAMRVPGRFFQPLLLCVSILAAFSISGFMKKTLGWAQWKKLGAVLLFACFLSFDYSISENEGEVMESVGEMPPVYDYLAGGSADSPILEIPVKISPYRYLHYQTSHWRPKIGGTSGWITPYVDRLAGLLDKKPSPRAFKRINKSRADTVVIHLNLYGEEAGRAWEKADFSRIGFRFAGRFEDALVWERLVINNVDSVLRLDGRTDSR